MSDQQNDQQEPVTPKTTKRVTPAAPAMNTASPAAPVEPKVTPKIRNRHDGAFRHDVFVSDSKDCLRNVSYEHLKPNLVKIPHKHIFHSHNSNGKALSRTGSACGHWHNVEHYMCPKTGEILAKCGPALHEVTIMTETGRTVTRIEPVAFEEEIQVGENAGKKRIIMDDHVHELVYEGSEELSPMGIQSKLESERSQARAMGIALHSDSVKDNTPPPMDPTAGATIA